MKTQPLFTESERPVAALLLRKAKLVLAWSWWEANPQGYRQARRMQYICRAIAVAQDRSNLDVGQKLVGQKLRNLIMRRLNGSGSLESWIVYQKGLAVFPLSTEDHDKMQQTRHAWIDDLIREFSQPAVKTETKHHRLANMTEYDE